MDKLRTLIVDDEAPAVENVRLLLNRFPFIEIVGACSDGRSAIEFIRRESPVLVFLDIQMPEVSGFEVLRELSPDNLPYIIFVTAYDHYAIQAFEINAVDYLLKPFTEERFELAVRRAQEAYENRSARRWNEKIKALLQADAAGPSTVFLKKLSVRVGSRIKFIPVEEVTRISAENQYVRIHTSGQTYLMRHSLNKLENELSPDDFYRVHRSAIVNIHAVQQVEPYFKGDYTLYLRDGTQTKLSRKRSEGLRRLLSW